MNTADIMQPALERTGMDSIPADSGIFRPCDNVKRIVLAIDIEIVCCNKMVRVRR